MYKPWFIRPSSLLESLWPTAVSLLAFFLLEIQNVWLFLGPRLNIFPVDKEEKHDKYQICACFIPSGYILYKIKNCTVEFFLFDQVYRYTTEVWHCRFIYAGFWYEIHCLLGCFFFPLADFNKNIYVKFLPSCYRGPVDIDDSLNIVCHAYHFGSLTWYKIDASSQEAREIKDPMRVNHKTWLTRHGHWEKNSTLMLRDVTENDAGTYVCSKSNGFNATKNVTIFIEVSGMSL